jgi:hypothetical protein
LAGDLLVAWFWFEVSPRLRHLSKNSIIHYLRQK